MPDRFIGKKEIAALFGSSSKAAEERLAKAGLRPINLGPGRKRGKRWLESAVMDALRSIHEDAQPKSRPPKPPRAVKSPYGKPVGEWSAAEVQAYLKKEIFTKQCPVQ